MRVKFKKEILITFVCPQCGQKDSYGVRGEWPLPSVLFTCSFCKLELKIRKGTLEPLKTFTLAEVREWHKRYRQWSDEVTKDLRKQIDSAISQKNAKQSRHLEKKP